MPEIVLLLLMGAGVAAMFLASTGVWVFVFARRRLHLPIRFPAESISGRPPKIPPLRTLAAPMGLVAIWLSLSLISLVGEGVTEMKRSQVYENASLSLTILVVLAGAVVVSMAATRCPPRRLGFTATRLWDQVLSGGLGFAASIAPVMLVGVLTLPIRSEQTMHPLLKFVQDSPSPMDLAVVGLLAIVIAPLFEELAFRVVLELSLEHFVNWRVALVIVSALFAAVHGFPDALPIFPLALILGFVYHRTRSYISVIVMHGLFNAYNLLLMQLYVYTQKLGGG